MSTINIIMKVAVLQARCARTEPDYQIQRQINI